MTCPICSASIRVIDSVWNEKDREFYRKRKCLGCNNVFYTAEKEIHFDEVFKRTKWNRYYRKSKKSDKTTVTVDRARTLEDLISKMQKARELAKRRGI